MPDETHDKDAIFARALELSMEERDAYLKEACGEDVSLRERMAKLLLAYGNSVGPSESISDSADLRGTVTEQPGTLIGRYKLLQQIGEGGFGVVFMAEQEKPVRRKVALKRSSSLAWTPKRSSRAFKRSVRHRSFLELS